MAHNGCILADSVGLGKTYTALAVIKYFELHNQRVLVLCPRKLFENWSLYPAIYGHRQNPFLEDRFAFTVLAHTDLSRTSGSSGGVNLANFHWENYHLVVIDESHNFRNDGGQRYQRLLEQVVKAGAKTKVLMLSATPVNTSLIDLRNQVYLMTEGREDAFQQSLGVGNIRTMMAAAQRQFKAWENEQAKRGRRDKVQLLENLGADFLRLLGGVSISRSRRQIERFYADEMERVGQFPKHEKPDDQYPQTDLRGELSYQNLAERIGQFTLSVYQPSEYVTDPARLQELAETRKRQNFNQQDSERFLIGMMRTNFLKRLESSAHSLTLTLDRTVGKIDDLLGKIERHQNDNQVNTELGEADVLGRVVKLSRHSCGSRDPGVSVSKSCRNSRGFWIPAFKVPAMPTLTCSLPPTASPRARTSRTATPCSTTTSTGTRYGSSSGSGALTASAAAVNRCGWSTTGPPRIWTCT